ncbi:cysteine-rich CWC family protein [uncultured Marinobacter sp.]|uniref:cysteine-rich CWC family protein n=1 Tax=uncultured Marinobacter sp. TaxID=187379 RepID=UPI00338EB3B7
MDALNRTKPSDAYGCPSCGAPVKCSIEQGKSASSCWCMTLPPQGSPEEGGRCVCKSCLLGNP